MSQDAAPRFRFVSRDKLHWCYFVDDVDLVNVRVRYWPQWRIWTGAGVRRDDGYWFGKLAADIDVERDIIAAIPREEFAALIAISIAGEDL